MTKTITSFVLFAGLVTATAQNLNITYLGTYSTGSFAESASEIVAYDPVSQRLYSTNAEANSVDIIDFSDPSNMTLIQSVSMSSYGDGVNSVAVKNGVVAVAVEASPKTNPGVVVLFNTSGVFQNQFTVGALPDMLTFTPDGTKILVANEGEPSDDYLTDPNGSISIITLTAAGQFTGIVTTLDFTAFTTSNIDPLVRLKAGASVAADLEPEYIAVNPAGTMAMVTLQENNAVAVVDLTNLTISDVIGLGYKDHSQIANKLDASDKGGMVNFQNFNNLYGMYMPDAITSYEVNGQTYYITANEGDGRDYSAYGDESRVKDLDLDSVAFPNAAVLQADNVLGRLTVSAVDGDTDNDGKMEELYVYGGRSFSIWNSQGGLVYDSGDQIEQQVYLDLPQHFNATNDDNDSFKNRSDNKGPEPEAAIAFEIGNIKLAAIGLERIGGFMIYDVSNPNAPVFLNYTNHRNFAVDADSSAAGDLGPEGIIFIPANQSPNGQNMLVVSNEVSGTVSAFGLSGYGIGVEDETLSNGIVAYPVPATDELHMSKAGDYTLRDITGKVVLRIEGGEHMNVKHLPAGTYLLEDANGGIQKVTKQ